jgi:hypothetical protein
MGDEGLMPAYTGTFIDVLKVGDEWFVLVVEKGHEMSNWFSAEAAAMAYAITHGKRLNVDKIRRL